MRWAILSDIHSNLEAFRAVLLRLEKEKIDRIAFLGDIIGYGADPEMCIELLKKTTECVVAGNHDLGAVGKSETTFFNAMAKTAIEWTANKIWKSHYDYLKELPLIKLLDDFFMVHSTPLYPSQWNYILSEDDAAYNFHFFDHSVCFIGHSHSPQVFILKNGDNLSTIKSTHFFIEEGSRYIINVGSVGQPRDGNPDSCFGILDTEKREFRYIREPYNIHKAQQKIIDAGLPKVLAERIGVGY
ncbi:MAG: metallophosphoesterase family protein [Thermodesulfobacteriota bacterium]|nr:metallophosphoesterase family protein [Thermodesulfobacteriota bacterium]